MGQTTTRVAHHLCEACATDWGIAGIGKAKHSVPIHKCSSCVSTKSASGAATEGMGQ